MLARDDESAMNAATRDLARHVALHVLGHDEHDGGHADHTGTTPSPDAVSSLHSREEVSWHGTACAPQPHASIITCLRSTRERGTTQYQWQVAERTARGGFWEFARAFHETRSLIQDPCVADAIRGALRLALWRDDAALFYTESALWKWDAQHT